MILVTPRELTTIAHKLGVLASQVKTLEKWHNVYFVVIIGRRPTFVSFNIMTTTHKSSDVYKVIAITKPRSGNRHFGTATNVGVKFRNVATGEQFWMNHFQQDSKPVKFGCFYTLGCVGSQLFVDKRVAK